MATFQDDQLNGNGREISHEKQTFSHVSRFAPKPFHRFPIFQPRTTPSSYTYICICTYVYIYIYTHTHAHTRVHIPLSTREKMLRWKIFPPPNYRDYSGSSSQTNYDQRIRSIFIFSRNRSVSPTYVAVSGSFEAKLLFPSFSLVGRPRVQPACTYLLAYSLATRYVARSRPCLRVHVGPSEVMAQKPTPTTLAG